MSDGKAVYVNWFPSLKPIWIIFFCDLYVKLVGKIYENVLFVSYFKGMLDQRHIILQYFYAYAAYCDSFSNHGICNGILNGFLHYVVSITYLLIRFSLMILMKPL